MSWNRRELLGSLGVASASTLLWAMGCATPKRTAPVAPEASDEVRPWLHDAVARLAAVYPSVHALAVAHRRTTAAVDVLGTGLSRAQRAGVILTVRDAHGAWREQVTSELSRSSVANAVKALLGKTGKPARVAFGPPPKPSNTLPPIHDVDLRNRVEAIMRSEHIGSSRIVYAAAMIDVDDVTLWSVAPGADLEQRTRRVRKRATCAAWNGSRPVVSEVERGWAGGIADQELDASEVAAASTRALLMMTPGELEEGEYAVVLEPTVVGSMIDALTRGVCTSDAARVPELAARYPIGAALGAPALAMIDDPTSKGSYGGFRFDDEGQLARPITLVDGGRLVDRLSDQRGIADKLASHHGRAQRAGHVGPIEPSASHLRVIPGATPRTALITDGLILEGSIGAVFDPRSDRIVIAAARAKELRRASETGRVYPEIELVGELSKLLAAITGLGSETTTIAVRAERAGYARWRSLEVPWLATRGVVRTRRSAR
ncbi:MAG: metallopeptidase TldD-related protein [Kofleriaceae bacterium]